jgi:histidinol phosphatase-like PHP family hydrolase
MDIINPYAPRGLWFKGNLHTHTEASPCGHYPLEEVAATYGDRIMRYDFLAITDHIQLTDVSRVQDMNGLIVLSGVEYKKESYQTLGINISSYHDDHDCLENHQELFDEVQRQGGINIICHPHIYREDYWPLERLLALKGYTAIEIYNHNVKMNNAGRAVATDLWDELLSRDRRVWGIASDDFHHRSRYGGGFIMVLAEKKSVPSLLEAVKAGSFYASSGILLDGIQVREDGTISLHAAAPRVPGTIFRFIGKGGRVLRETAAAPGEPVFYRPAGDEGYVRVEARREDGAMAWTQPFLLA